MQMPGGDKPRVPRMPPDDRPGGSGSGPRQPRITDDEDRPVPLSDVQQRLPSGDRPGRPRPPVPGDVER
jgi:hypothetical protein